MNKNGFIFQIVGPVVDVSFSGELPLIKNAVVIDPKGYKLTAEVQQHLEGGVVRALVLGPAEGLKRGMEVVDTGDSVKVPVGPETLGRVFNVLGEPVDKAGPVKKKENT